MNIRLVVINQNQADTISKIEEKTRVIKDRIWVLDRCSDNSSGVCESLGLDFRTTDPTIQGFQAGHARNTGALNFDGDIIFLDGDRIPYTAFTEEFLFELFSRQNVCLFRAMQEDSRIFDTYDWTTNPGYGKIFNGVYSAGISLTQNAVRKIREYRNSQEIFDPDFNGTWGEEDINLGDVCYHLDLTCGVAPNAWALSGDYLVPTKRSEAPEYRRQVELRFQKRSMMKRKKEEILVKLDYNGVDVLVGKMKLDETIESVGG